MHNFELLKTYGGGIQSIIGVTGAHNASADANTTIETNPLLAARSRSEMLINYPLSKLGKISITKYIFMEKPFLLVNIKLLKYLFYVAQ